jgi:uracil-DNA glycosylase family protein
MRNGNRASRELKSPPNQGGNFSGSHSFKAQERSERRVKIMIRNEGQPSLFDEPSLFDTPETRPEPAVERFGSLDALYAALRRDDQPPSPEFSSRLVVGEGPADACILLVGEQPGDQEDLADRPFVGPAGRLLDHCMADAGMERRHVFVTNAVKRFKFTPRGKRRIHSTPSAGDIAHYRWWLDEEIRLVDPAVVVALGSTAVHALTGKKQALAPLRGAPMTTNGRSLLVTVHPSFLLRLPDEQARDIELSKFIDDLKLAVAAAR